MDRHGSEQVGVLNSSSARRSPVYWHETVKNSRLTVTSAFDRKPSSHCLAELGPGLSEANPTHTPTPDDDGWIIQDLDELAPEERVGDKSDAVSAHPFHPDHPLYRTHYIRCDRRDLGDTVPHFAGGALPRMDQGAENFIVAQ